MMAADMNDDPLSRSDQDHATREAVRESISIRAMLKASRGLDNEQENLKESENE